MNDYDQGNIVRFRVRFVSQGRAVDPSALSFAYRVGSNPSSSPIIYTNATVPAVGVIARTAMGDYETWVDTTNISGSLVAKYTATGTHEAQVWDEVIINPKPF